METGISKRKRITLATLLLSVQSLACEPSAEDFIEKCREDRYCRVDELEGYKCSEDEENEENSHCAFVGPEEESYGVYQIRMWVPRKEDFWDDELMFPYLCQVAENYVDVEQNLIIPIRNHQVTSPRSYCDALFNNK